MYTQGCRCEPCKAANAEYRRLVDYPRTKSTVIAARHKYRVDNADQIPVQAAKSYRKHKDDRIKKQKRYNATHNGQVALQRNGANYRARKRNQFVEAVDRDVVFEMHGGICGICGTAIIGKFHVDHVVPISKGGLHCYANTQPAHPKCNQEKFDKLIARGG